MNIQRKQIAAISNERRLLICLPVVWTLGILFGILVVIITNDIYAVANASVRLRPNLAILYIINILPLAVLVALIAVRQYGLVYLLLFLYGLFRGFCGMCIILAFAASSWLVRCLHLFSSSLVSLLMWWLIYSYTNCRHGRSKLIYISALLVSIVKFLDYFIISPILIGVF